MDDDAAQHEAAARIREAFQGELTRLGLGTCVTTIEEAADAPAEFGGPYYLAEDYHQAYLHKNPNGYCNHGPNGVTCPVGITDLARPRPTSSTPPTHHLEATAAAVVGCLATTHRQRHS